MLKTYQAKEGELKNIERKLGQLKDTGATGEELALLYEGLKIVDDLQDEQQAAIASVARGEEQQAIALLFGKIYELEMERAQSKIDHFRVLLDKRIIADVQAATNTSKTLRTASEMMVGLTALLFLFVMGLFSSTACCARWCASVMWFTGWPHRITPSKRQISTRSMR